ncbi:MAG TPA: hypothetical protein VJ783_26995 [Pirellulales bacterium]|nr:hypothetical protein [Pirellulales bacterium]
MFKLLSMFLVAGATTVAGVNSAMACGCGSDQAAAPAPAQTARASRAPTAVTQNGRQSIRRYSVSPGPAYRAPSMRRGRSYSGPSWTATRKILGY